jgi:hypothetical protein
MRRISCRCFFQILDVGWRYLSLWSSFQSSYFDAATPLVKTNSESRPSDYAFYDGRLGCMMNTLDCSQWVANVKAQLTRRVPYSNEDKKHNRTRIHATGTHVETAFWYVSPGPWLHEFQSFVLIFVIKLVALSYSCCAWIRRYPLVLWRHRHTSCKSYWIYHMLKNSRNHTQNHNPPWLTAKWKCAESKSKLDK